jgi:hypothetical protein
MKKCSFSDTYPFINDQLLRKHTAFEREELKKKFCGGTNSQWARFIVTVALGFDSVPANLFPNYLYRVSTILDLP